MRMRSRDDDEECVVNAAGTADETHDMLTGSSSAYRFGDTAATSAAGSGSVGAISAAGSGSTAAASSAGAFEKAYIWRMLFLCDSGTTFGKESGMVASEGTKLLKLVIDLRV